MRTMIRGGWVFGVAVLLAVGMVCDASFVGGDDFDDDVRDPARWGPDRVSGGDVQFNEFNGRLELSGSSGGGEHWYVQCPWVLNAPEYGESWSAIIDVELEAPSTFLDDDSLSIGLGIHNSADSRDYADWVLRWSAERTDFWLYGRVVTNSSLSESILPGLSGDPAVSLRLHWDADADMLRFLCDPDGSAGGYSWTSYGAVNLAAGNDNWGMGAGDTFEVAVTGAVGYGAGSGGQEATADNFVAVPEPSAMLLLTVAAAGAGRGRLGRRRASRAMR